MSLIFKIVGYADEPVPYTFYIFRDPDVDAFFGDVNGDGRVGLSHIFPISTITDGEPFLAAIDASFDDFFDVPAPASWMAILIGLDALTASRRRRG